MTEIPNFPNYLIQRDGRVWSKNRGKFMTSHIQKGGYQKITLCQNGKNKFVYIHRLLAITFIPNPDNKPCIDHIDRNPQNNNLDNLRWVTHSENMINRKVTGKIKERFINYSKDGSLRVYVRINGKLRFCKTNKNWTLEQALNVRNIVLKFLKFPRVED